MTSSKENSISSIWKLLRRSTGFGAAKNQKIRQRVGEFLAPTIYDTTEAIKQTPAGPITNDLISTVIIFDSAGIVVSALAGIGTSMVTKNVEAGAVAATGAKIVFNASIHAVFGKNSYN